MQNILRALAVIYGLNFDDYSNAEDVIRAVLKDRKRDGSKVQAFLQNSPESDLSVFINLPRLLSLIHTLTHHAHVRTVRKYGKIS